MCYIFYYCFVVIVVNIITIQEKILVCELTEIFTQPTQTLRITYQF